MERTNQENKNNLGALISEHRKRKKLSLQQLSDRSNLSASYLNQIELNKKRNISISSLIKISDSLSVPISELIKLFKDESNLERETQSLGELLICNSFTVANKRISIAEKEIAIDILETIFDFDWVDREARNKEIMELLTLLDNLF